MSSLRFHPSSLLAGAGLTLIAFLSLGQKAATSGPSVEYRIVADVEAKDLVKLAEEGWEFAGYLGQGIKGSGNDETLWRRPVK